MFTVCELFNVFVLEDAAHALGAKINNKFIMCKTKYKDRYNRFIGECFKDKTNINRWMVLNGYAVAYKRYSKKFVAQENLAKKENLGLWTGTFEMPWEWRKKN